MKGKIAVWIAIGIMVRFRGLPSFCRRKSLFSGTLRESAAPPAPGSSGSFRCWEQRGISCIPCRRERRTARDIPYLMIPLLLLAVEGIIVSNALEIIRVEQIDKNRIQTAAILLTGWLMAFSASVCPGHWPSGIPAAANGIRHRNSPESCGLQWDLASCSWPFSRINLCCRPCC